MNKQHIAASQRLSECKGMGKAEYNLLEVVSCREETSLKGIYFVREVDVESFILTMSFEYGDCEISNHGSWLKIDSQSEWCSFKFLQRCGYTIEQTDTGWVIRNRIDSSSWHRVAFFCDGDMHCPSDDIELAIIKAIIYIHDELPMAYNKGIKPLMEGAI